MTTMTKKLSVGIVGGGAVGLTYACFLADTCDILIKTRTQSQADSLSAKGISLTRGGKTALVQNIKATAVTKELEGCDLVIVAVKTYDTESIGKELSDTLRATAEVVTLQNGIVSFDVLKRVMTHPERVFAGVTYIGARRTGDNSISLGQFSRSVIDNRAAVLIEALRSTPYGAESSDDIRQAVWDKMVLNAGQNALSAATNLSARQMLESSECLEIAQNILDELKHVAEAEGLSFGDDLLQRLTANWGSGDDFYPSMWQDVHSGKRTEVDAINGAISRLGQKYGISTPYNHMITLLIKSIETTANEV